MSEVLDLGLTPNPDSALDVLAFILCPVSVFVPDGNPDELRTIREVLRPIRAAAIERWAKRRRTNRSS